MALNDLQYIQAQAMISPTCGSVTNAQLDGITTATTMFFIPAYSQWVGYISISGAAVAVAATSASITSYGVVASSSTVVIGFSNNR